MFSMAASKPHSIRKRMVSNVYSKSYIQSSPELHKISQVMIYERLLPLMEKAATEKQPLDVLELNYSTTMDFIIAFMFGLQNCSNFLLDVEARKHWLKVYQSHRPCKVTNLYPSRSAFLPKAKFLSFFKTFPLQYTILKTTKYLTPNPQTVSTPPNSPPSPPPSPPSTSP